jgi:membrane-associated protease RseP (regulator of RpoE activity)
LSDSKPEGKKSEQKRFEFSFPLLTVRTQIFSKVFNKLGSFRFSRWISWAALVIVPIVAGVGLYLLIGSLVALLWNPAVGEAARQAGPAAYLLLPGLNPFLPIFYGWFAIIAAIAIHEGAHGVAARSLGLNVKSSGLLFFLIIPIGAFVDVDEEQIKKAPARDSSRVMAAGVGANVVIATVCLIGVLVIVGGLAPVVDGVYVNEVTSPNAMNAGLLPEDVLVSVDNVRINRTDDLRQILANKTAGETVHVIVIRGETWQNQISTDVNLTTSENRTIIGISIADLLTEARLKNYQNVTIPTLALYLVPPAIAPGLVPFSDSLIPFYEHPLLGGTWHIWANVLYWLWFVNVNLAVFNALPLYPLDGGRIFNIALKNRLRKPEHEKLVTGITAAVTIAIVLIIALTVIIPFILPLIV